MRPEGLKAALKFHFQGRWLFRHSLAQNTTDHIAQRLLKHLEVNLAVQGLEHIPQTPCIVAALHEGLADPLVLLTLPLPLKFAVREEIFGWPGVGRLLRASQQIPVNPEGNSYRFLLRQTKAATARGQSVVVFPQGSVLGIEIGFQRGAFGLCKALGLPMLPVALSGTHRIWEHPFSPTLRYGVNVHMTLLPLVPAQRFQGDLEPLRLEIQHQLKTTALALDPQGTRRYVPERDGLWKGYRFDIDPNYQP
jgi:1-acyl-sn-glycerol-3-phosphate acyltransferase